MGIRTLILPVLTFLLLSACSKNELLEAGRHYQSHQDMTSLQYVVNNFPKGNDTTKLQAILGQGIDFGFDMRFLVDSTGPTGCAVGAVFHLDEGKVTDAWTGEICE